MSSKKKSSPRPPLNKSPNRGERKAAGKRRAGRADFIHSARSGTEKARSPSPMGVIRERGETVRGAYGYKKDEDDVKKLSAEQRAKRPAKGTTQHAKIEGISVGRVARFIKKRLTKGERLQRDAAKFVTALLAFWIRRILMGAEAIRVRNLSFENVKRVHARHIFLAIRDEPSLAPLLKNAVIPVGGSHAVEAVPKRWLVERGDKNPMHQLRKAPGKEMRKLVKAHADAVVRFRSTAGKGGGAAHSTGATALSAAEAALQKKGVSLEAARAIKKGKKRGSKKASAK